VLALLERLWMRIEALRRRDSRPVDWGRLTGMLADIGVSAPVSVLVSVGYSVRCASVRPYATMLVMEVQ
jgi:hypothetical protein